MMQFFNFHHHRFFESFGIYNLDFLEEAPENLFSVGIHPKDILSDLDERFLFVEKMSLHQNCFAIGECGLDGLVTIDENLQKKVFEKQIYLANEIRKPLIIHCVRKFAEIINFKNLSSISLVIHGFNRKKSIADALVAEGFYLSFGKAILQNVSLQQIVKDFPVDKMFLETDDSEIKIEDLYQQVSKLKNMKIENLRSQILENLEKIKENVR